MVYNRIKKAAQGIGTLIIFIALILVAAVAAGVLIQTAGSLQSKSLDVGRQTQEKITADIEVVQVYVTNTSDAQINVGADNFTIVVRLGSGSTPIKLQDMLLRFDTASGTQSLTFNASSTGDGSGYSASIYDVSYRINGSNHVNGYVSNGDLAEFSFTYGGGIAAPMNESQTGTLRLVSKNGAVKPVQVTTPSAMIETITYLFP